MTSGMVRPRAASTWARVGRHGASGLIEERGYTRPVPELPEIQALAERLDEMFAGAVLERIEPLQFSALKTFQPGPEVLIGETLQRAGRRGKYVILDFGGVQLLVHLSQGGRVVVEDPPKRTRPRGGVLRLAFADRPSILVREFGTERRAGWWILPTDEQGPLERLGPEPDSDSFEHLVLQGDDRRRVHTLLRDQRTVAGIGRGYSDDILHRARISPFASLESLEGDQRQSLLEAIRAVLTEALDAERRRTGGLPTKLGDHFSVHGRYGHPCPRCGDDLRRVSYESHEVTYCPSCQTGGKLLADRRMSRLLK
jgi:formamidopyrimidine-DNA glycosylase